MAEAAPHDAGSAPLIRYTMSEQVKKGEDFYCARTTCRHGALCLGPTGYVPPAHLGAAEVGATGGTVKDGGRRGGLLVQPSPQSL